MTYKHVFETIAWDNLERMKELLNEETIINARNKQGFTLIHEAALSPQILEYLLTTYSCPIINERCYEGRTPFFYACETQIITFFSITSLQLLIKYGADINIPNNEGLTPIHLSCRNGDPTMTKFLIDNNAKLTTNEITGYNVLHYIAISNCISCFNLLVNYDTNNLKSILNNSDFDEGTALMLAVDVANFEIAKELVKFGADCNIIGRNITALHLAVVSQIPELFMLIWEKTDFDVLLSLKEVNNLVKWMVKYGWFHPDRIKVLFMVLSHPRILEILTENTKILTVFFYRIRFVKNVHEIDMVNIIKKFLNIGLKITQNDLRVFFLNFYKFENSFELLDVMIKYGGNIDDKEVITFMIEIYPNLMPKLLFYCIKTNPIDVINYFTKILRINKDMIKLIILMLHFCTVHQPLKLKLTEHLTHFCYALINRSQGDEDLIILYQYILRCLKSQNVASLRELSRDVLRKKLAGNCSTSKDYLDIMAGFELPKDIVSIIQCTLPVNIFMDFQ